MIMLKTKKKSKDPLIVEVDKTLKKFSVFYSIGNEPDFFVAHGTDYKLSTLDVQSGHSGEIFAFPVIFLIDDEFDSLDIIPINKIDNLRYNYGYKEEAKQFQTQMEALKKEMKKHKEDAGTVVKDKHDRQYYV